MNDNILDFEARKGNHEVKRKEAKVDAMRKAFRAARGEAAPDKSKSSRKQGRKSKKK